MGSKSEQQFIPGTEPKIIPLVHAAIGKYVDARDRRQELTKIEVEEKASLLQAMKEAKIFDYDVDGREAHVSIDESVKAKVRVPEPEE